jgi:hypothetical protein
VAIPEDRIRPAHLNMVTGKPSRVTAAPTGNSRRTTPWAVTSYNYASSEALTLYRGPGRQSISRDDPRCELPGAESHGRACHGVARLTSFHNNLPHDTTNDFIMSSVAGTLDSDSIQAIAAWLSSLTPSSCL